VEKQGLQEDVHLYKEMKYQEGYHDYAEGKPSRYHLIIRCNLQSRDPSRCLLKNLSPPANASDAIAKVAIRGKHFEPSSLAGTSLEPHVSVA